MKLNRHTRRLAIVAVALLSGLSVAAAADSASKTGANAMSKPSSSKASPQAMATDTVVLSKQQQKDAWRDIKALATKEKAPAGFTAMVGALVPSKLDTHPVPVSTANKVPVLRPYQYAMLDTNKLLIVNPSDHKIADIITQ
jgi:hypothetical protein